ncbi:hypothetical protein GCM10009868_11050 [Terrabacter aerolatus]|uniref:Uncharacterized protein n=1 Tax=Terrabacter aerolatus TaxID=422442 RepID=A0A512D3Y5_9MICO|nr:hypothetical protein TAE01_29880 [Terrabacter aerolatus]
MGTRSSDVDRNSESPVSAWWIFTSRPLRVGPGPWRVRVDRIQVEQVVRQALRHEQGLMADEGAAVEATPACDGAQPVEVAGVASRAHGIPPADQGGECPQPHGLGDGARAVPGPTQACGADDIPVRELLQIHHAIVVVRDASVLRGCGQPIADAADVRASPIGAGCRTHRCSGRVLFGRSRTPAILRHAATSAHRATVSKGWAPEVEWRR